MLTGPHYVPRTPAPGAPTFSREAQRGRSAGAGHRAGAVVVGSGGSAFRYVWGGLGGSFIPCQDSQKTTLF